MAGTQDGPGPHPTTRELASGPNHAAISTLMPSGHVQTHDLSVGVEGDRLYVNTERGQRARERIDELSQRYDGRPYPADTVTTEQVTVWIEPERQTIAG